MIGSGREIMRMYRKLYYSNNSVYPYYTDMPHTDSERMYVLWIEPADDGRGYWMFLLSADTALRWFAYEEEADYEN